MTMKKNYLTPSMTVLKLNMQQMITTTSKAGDVNSGDVGYGGGGNNPGSRRRGHNGWEDEEEEEEEW